MIIIKIYRLQQNCLHFINQLISVKTYLNFVVLPHRHGSDVVFNSQLLRKRGTHQLPPDVGGSIEMPFSILPSGNGDLWIPLHFERFWLT